MAQNDKFLNHFTIDDRIFISKTTKLIEACKCSDNLMISIYHIDEKRFLYYNKKFKENIGDRYISLLHKDCYFWFSMVTISEVFCVKQKFSNFLKNNTNKDALILKYTVINNLGKEMFLKHEISLCKLGRQRLLVNYFFDISGKKQIDRCINPYNKTNRLTVNSGKLKAHISPRENEVLRLIANGFSSKQIADQLFISDHTAITHRKHLIEKFNVKNTAQLIKEASKVMEL